MISAIQCIVPCCEVCVCVFHQLPQNQKYQIHLRSHSGPIYVLLVNKDTDSASPVVVQVPPPKDSDIAMETSGSTSQGSSSLGGEAVKENPATLSTQRRQIIKVHPDTSNALFSVNSRFHIVGKLNGMFRLFLVSNFSEFNVIWQLSSIRSHVNN